jgi:hypothetical protein
MVILSSVLYKNYFPLLVVATYVIAPLPNWICSRAANPDDFMESSGSGIIDFGRFLTGFLVVMGIGMLQVPVELWIAGGWLLVELGANFSFQLFQPYLRIATRFRFPPWSCRSSVACSSMPPSSASPGSSGRSRSFRWSARFAI